MKYTPRATTADRTDDRDLARTAAFGRAALLCTLVLALCHSSGAHAKGDLSPLERELRGFILSLSRLTAREDLPVSGRLEKKSEFITTTASSARARVEITSSGQVRYSVSSLGSRAEASRSDIHTWVPAETALEIVGFSVEQGYVDVGVRPSEYMGQPPGGLAIQVAPTIKIRVFSSSAKPTCSAVLSLLATVLDFGGPLERLQRLEQDFARLTMEIEAGRQRSKQGVSSSGSGSPASLGRLLTEAVENRRTYGTLVQSEPADLRRLEQELEGAKARERAIDAELAEALPGLVAAAGSPPGQGTSYAELEAWATGLRSTVRQVVERYAECLALGCENKAATAGQWWEVERDLARFEAGVARSAAEGCNAPEPISRQQFELALLNAPDPLIARRILRCGVSFAVDEATLAAVGKNGSFRETQAALRPAATFRLTTDEIRDRLVRVCTRSLAEIPADAGRWAESSRASAEAAAAGEDLPVISQGSLDWTGSSLGQMPWVDGKNRCAGLTLAGRSWRLPSIEELESLFLSGAVGHLSSRARVQIVGCCIWSSTTHGDRVAVAIDVEDGERDRMNRRLGLANVLCVAARS